ncbi:MAG: class I SAM-dependent methyltransferase [Kouleothrix sp.]|jgi:SAM-dependent methyltransferase|nr:class I SAM-dependent methyltransferase [Kouleothrix sp.]
MDLATFNWLLSDAGQALIAAAAAGDLSEGARLRELTRLRRLADPARAAAAYELARLRRHAAAKFAGAASMYFTREALEQSSGELIAGYRARRYQPFARVADLCCGIGGDTLALARVAQVAAVDRDPLRLAIAAANARAAGLAERVTFIEGDLVDLRLPAAEAIFFDPARRADGRRAFTLAGYQPPVTLVGRWSAHTPAIGVKAAPGLSDADLAGLAEQLGRPALEAEFISVDGELKEAALWFGPLASPGRRATLLTSARPDQPAHMHTRDSAGPAPLAPPGAFLYEPDPAVIRAHLVAGLAQQIGAAQLDREIAYLTSDQPIATPFARCWRVLEWLPFSLKRLRARLRALDAGAVTVKKRGSPLDTDALARQLSAGGPRPLVVILTFVAGRPAALICEGPIAPPAAPHQR